MTELPSGTVTLLFSDVEGSTRLLQRLGERYAGVLEEHRRLLRAAFGRWGGREVDTQGDAFFVAFPRAADAVAAAVEAQRALAAQLWPDDATVRVRMGLHTGEPRPTGGGYVGLDVHRAARVGAAAHGGQLLLSQTTSDLVAQGLPEGVLLRDLGGHRLKDLQRPERIFQLVIPGLPAEFPSLRTLEAHPHNLPVQPTPFIGRQHEVRALRGLLTRDDVRLVTLTGPGGTGKTRLGLQVAAELIDAYEDGVFSVELATISDPSLVVATIAQTLGLEDASGRPLLDVLVDRLRGQRLLLLLDNFEHLLAAATAVDDLLRACPRLSVLVTSRAPLQLRGEHEFPVPPLALPDPGRSFTPAALSQYDAVALFIERATAIKPDFAVTNANAPSVAEICVRLDGLPLAIELAAARLRLLSPEAMLPRLGHGLALLTGGRRDLPARQQTLRSTIAWSYDLLSEAEQRLFRRLSLFVGGFSLEAAAAVCVFGAEIGDQAVPPTPNAQHPPPLNVLDGVGSLIDSSLVRPGEMLAGEPRFSMLETIREYGQERLQASNEAPDVHNRHLAWYLNLAERAAQQANGPDWAEWLDRLEAEHDNFRAALRWSEGASCDPELGLRLARALAITFWTIRGHFREGRVWLARLLARPSARTAARASALDRAGYLALRQNDYPAASRSFEEALAIWSELGDRHGMAMTLRNFGVVPHHQRDYDRARTMLQESLSLSRELGDLRGVGTSLRNLADLARDRAEYAEAATAYEESLSLARQRGDTHEIAYALRGLGNVARARGEYTCARQLLYESLGLLKALRDRRCAPICLEGLACMTVGPDWAERATRLLSAGHAIQETTGAPASPTEIADYQRTEADARAALGEERFAAVWAAGAAMSFDEATAYALAEGEPSKAAGTPTTPLPRPEVSEITAAPPERPAPAHAERQVGVPLSAREREVVALIAGGLSNREISDALVLSVRTVERHIENVYNRLGISGKAGRAIVTAYALRHHLTESA